jgi:hypothetical protein
MFFGSILNRTAHQPELDEGVRVHQLTMRSVRLSACCRRVMTLNGAMARQSGEWMRLRVVLPRLRQSPGDLLTTRRESKWTQRIVVCLFTCLCLRVHLRGRRTNAPFCEGRSSLFVVRMERNLNPQESRSPLFPRFLARPDLPGLFMPAYPSSGEESYTLARAFETVVSLARLTRAFLLFLYRSSSGVDYTEL